MANKKKGVQYAVTRPEEDKKVLYNGVPTNGITKATLHNTAFDVVDIIERSRVPLMVADTSKYELKPQYSATTSCLVDEKFDEEKGMDMAKRKVLKRYNTDKIAAIDVALADLEIVRGVCCVSVRLHLSALLVMKHIWQMSTLVRTSNSN